MIEDVIISGAFLMSNVTEDEAVVSISQGQENKAKTLHVFEVYGACLGWLGDGYMLSADGPQTVKQIPFSLEVTGYSSPSCFIWWQCHHFVLECPTDGWNKLDYGAVRHSVCEGNASECFTSGEVAQGDC